MSNHNYAHVQLNSSHWNADDSERWIKVEGETIHMSAKALTIIWGNSDRFWKWIELNESVFGLGAELIQVSWIEITGMLDLHKYKLSHSKTYEVIFIIKFKDDAFGWHHIPITFEVATPDGKKYKRNVFLETFRERGKGLQEIHAGDFNLPSGHDKGSVNFGMFEVESQWWKGALILEGVKVRPKAVIITTSRGIKTDSCGKGCWSCFSAVCR